MKDVLSTRELAEAIGVSESSIKRWADDGALHVARTTGGHRRIPLGEAIRFIRESGAVVIHPEILGLDGAAAAGRAEGTDTERLFAFLESGAAAQARGLIQSLYLAGRSAASIIDGPMREAMTRIGELWRHRGDGIFCEHRATDICIQALSQLRLLVSPADDAPVAMGGAPAGDPYILPSLAAATVLAAEGFRAVNLGPDTPIETFELAAEELEPALVWISASLDPLPERTSRQIRRLAEKLRPRGLSLVIGGRSLPDAPFPPTSNLHLGRSMSELAAFAHGLMTRLARA